MELTTVLELIVLIFIILEIISLIRHARLEHSVEEHMIVLDEHIRRLDEHIVRLDRQQTASTPRTPDQVQEI
jgi:hypothetical protein